MTLLLEAFVPFPVQNCWLTSFPDHIHLPSVPLSVAPSQALFDPETLATVVCSAELVIVAKNPVRPPSVMPAAVVTAAGCVAAPLVIMV